MVAGFLHARWWDPRLIQNLPQFVHSTRDFAASAAHFSASATAFLNASVKKPEISRCRMYLGKKVFMCRSVLHLAMVNLNLLRVRGTCSVLLYKIT